MEPGQVLFYPTIIPVAVAKFTIVVSCPSAMTPFTRFNFARSAQAQRACIRKSLLYIFPDCVAFKFYCLHNPIIINSYITVLVWF